jgi:hypothetical protein
MPDTVLMLLALIVLLGWIILFDPIVFPDAESKSIEDGEVKHGD